MKLKDSAIDRSHGGSSLSLSLHPLESLMDVMDEDEGERDSPMVVQEMVEETRQ